MYLSDYLHAAKGMKLWDVHPSSRILHPYITH